MSLLLTASFYNMRGQNEKYNLILNKVRDTIFKEFIAYDSQSVPISVELLHSPWTLMVEENGKWELAVLDTPKNQFTNNVDINYNSETKKFQIKGMPDSGLGDTVYMKLSGKRDTAIIKLVVKPPVKKDDKCTLLKPQEYKCDESISYSNEFGEDPRTYTKDKVVYVMDFNPKEGVDQVLYKVSQVEEKGKWWQKKKYKQAVKIEPVNLASEKLKSKEYVQFKVHNINRYVYNISISDTVTPFQSEPPFLLNELFIGNPESFLGSLVKTIGTLGKLDEPGIQSNGDTIMIGTKDSGLDKLTRNIVCFQDAYYQLQQRLLQSYWECQDYSCCPEYPTLYAELAQKLLEINQGLTSLLRPSEALEISLKDKKDRFKLCEVIISKEKLLESLQGQEGKEEEIKALKKELEGLKKATKDCKGDENQALGKEIKELEAQLKPYVDLRTLKETLPDQGKLQKLLLYVNAMTTQSQSYVKTLPKLEGTELKLKVRVDARDSLVKRFGYLESGNYIIPYSFPIIGYWYLSFSSGSFIGAGKDYRTKEYDWRKVPGEGGVIGSDSKYELAESGRQPNPVGFNALANLQWKADVGFGLGFCAGVGVTVEDDPRLAYMGGLSFSFGKTRNIVLSTGPMYTRVNVKDNTLLEGYLYENRESIKYYQEYKPGWFVSLTFTPFSQENKN